MLCLFRFVGNSHKCCSLLIKLSLMTWACRWWWLQSFSRGYWLTLLNVRCVNFAQSGLESLSNVQQDTNNEPSACPLGEDMKQLVEYSRLFLLKNHSFYLSPSVSRGLSTTCVGMQLLSRSKLLVVCCQCTASSGCSWDSQSSPQEAWWPLLCAFIACSFVIWH